MQVEGVSRAFTCLLTNMATRTLFNTLRPLCRVLKFSSRKMSLNYALGLLMYSCRFCS